MGTGKGGVEGWVAVVKPGRVIFEVEGVTREIAKEAFHRAHHKLPIKTQLDLAGAGPMSKIAAALEQLRDLPDDELRAGARDAPATSCSASSSASTPTRSTSTAHAARRSAARSRAS